MNEALGELLPLAVGVALSPVPIIAVILMLLGPRARAASLCFAAGWAAGLAVVAVVAALVVGAAVDDADGDGDSTTAAVIKIALGGVLVALAVRQWTHRPREGDQPMPAWMSAIDTVGAGRAVGLGLLLSTANPKNLPLGVSAGVAVGSADLSPGPATAALAGYVVVGSLTVIGPAAGYLLASDRLRSPLRELRAWLTTHNAAVMSVLLVVLGAGMLGHGLEGL